MAIASALTHRVAIGLLADTPELGDLRLSIEVPPPDVLRSVHDSRHCRTWARGTRVRGSRPYSIFAATATTLRCSSRRPGAALIKTLELYGRHLAADIDNDGAPVDVLIGLSAGSQAATVAASLTSLVSRLVLVSPTVDPAYRSMIKQLYVFVRGDPHDNSAFYHHVPDWARAGIPRIFRGFASAIALHLEDILPRVTAEITIIHTEYDPLTTHAYAAQLAEMAGGKLVLMPGASHSWPQQDSARFLRFINELVS